MLYPGVLGETANGNWVKQMNLAADIRTCAAEVTRAVRRPEELALRWRDRTPKDSPSRLIFAVLMVSAGFGTVCYGIAANISGSVLDMLYGALLLPLSTGTAWLIALPALYIVNTALGSKLDFSTTLLAALLTVSFGSTALLAGVPVMWFFTLATQSAWCALLVNIVIFLGAGIAMADTFARVIGAVEPERHHRYARVWLGLVGFIGLELIVLLDAFAL